MMGAVSEIRILHPIMQPITLTPLTTATRDKCGDILTETRMTSAADKSTAYSDADEKDTDDDLSGIRWLKTVASAKQWNVIPTKKGDRTDQTKWGTGGPAKSLLRRHHSSFDKVEITYVAKNSTRTHVVENAKPIFNLEIYTGGEEARIHTVISNIAKYEDEWRRFPISHSAAQSMSYDKPT